MLKCEKEACDKSIYLKGFCRIHYKEFNVCEIENCEKQSTNSRLCANHYSLRYNLEKPWTLFFNLLKLKLKSKYHVEKSSESVITKDDIKDLWALNKAHKMKNPVLIRKDTLRAFSKENCAFVDNPLNYYTPEIVSSRRIKKILKKN